jgi:hypothetical protein
MIHGLGTSSYSTVPCPYEFLRQQPSSIVFLTLFITPDRLYAQDFRAECSPYVSEQGGCGLS